ncbi:UdgX family uracil-DNA binding protein [Paraburkholderia sp. MPAMCS5]|uniref:UdgX family uracil-DNA binding protein n=1 Tax=Paraburkholderia sp. MPAMCS5 TaxID=3112563 RepID=UPI002E189405|nr:UdgX family uracil-DNA binding protein [Paraburkholderia sp. MPAMCS5]MEC5406390.1 UdgX family uracil-DNA binding protein [Paraburkholderia sp. MPAMCS5]
MATSKRPAKHPSERAPSEKSETRADSDVDPAQQPATLDDCRRCPLWRNATQAVPGEGPRHAQIMMVGEQPGDKEDLQGLPFVGPAGALLDDALAEAGVGRKEVYVTNAVKHFKWTPRGKRRMHKTPAQREVKACRYWLDQELDSVGAQVVVALGATALKAVLDDPKSRLQDSIGKVIEHGGRVVIATYHPSFALRAPDPETRHRAYAAIVAALANAKKLAQQRK